jgi:hypothetical protein
MVGAGMAARTQVGDVLELQTPRGLAYAQYTHRNAKFGSLIRVLPGFYADRPVDLATLVSGPSTFVVFYPVRAAVSKGVATVVARVPVPQHASEFPLFRSGTPDPFSGKVNNWWLWDGEQSWPVGALSPDQRRLPIRMIVNHTGLIELIATEWTPEKDKW